MNKIFIYYSLTGNGDEVANYLNTKHYDIRKVETSETLPNNYILRIICGGYKAMINYEDKLINFNSDISSYDEIIIGTPIWNSRISSPINSVLKQIDLTGKKLSFILYSGAAKSSKSKEFIKSNYPNANIIELIEPKKNKDELNKLK